MKKVTLHIGYPKCFSTTLQRNFFEKHSEINFGGIGIQDNISYSNINIEFIFESLLKYANQSFWDMHKEYAKQQIEEFVNSSDNLTVFSSEHLSFQFINQQIDSLEKLKRLSYLFQSFLIKIILIEREPISFIRSYFKELVKMGYNEYYNHFLKESITLYDRNYLSDLSLNNKKKQINFAFPKGELIILNFEYLKKNSDKINLVLSETLGINNKNLEIINENPSLDNASLNNLILYNRQNPHGLGVSALEPFEKHRNRYIYTHSKVQYIESEIFKNVIEKRKAIEVYNKNKNGIFYMSDEILEFENQIKKIINEFNDILK